MNRLRERYLQEVVPHLMQRFGYRNRMQVPRVEKVRLNMGVGEGAQTADLLDAAAEQLGLIAGQRPHIRRARKSISAFNKLRAGQPVGCAVTLRGERMYEFLDKLFSITLPRIRDFRGLSGDSFDGRGNYCFGVREQTIFPEINYDKIDRVRGLDVCITTTANSDEEARELLTEMGLPLRRA